MLDKVKENFKAGYEYGTGIAKRKLAFLMNDSAQAAPMAMMAAVLGAAIMLGIITIVMVLMPSIAGDIITAINVSENNTFYTLIQNADDKATSSFNLLWVAVLVGVVVIIIGGVAGLAFIFVRTRA